ncbi:TPA: hypothetical protein ACE6Q3_002189, partial [Neisseria gonorrhoeae]
KYINHIVNDYWDNSVAQNISCLLFSGRLFICLCVSTHKTATAICSAPNRKRVLPPAIGFAAPNVGVLTGKKKILILMMASKKPFRPSAKRNG